VIVTIANLIAPNVTHPTDVWYLEGGVENIITWYPDDLFPISYYVLIDGLEVASESWDGSSISYTVDGLTPGVHNCTIVVIDINDNMISDSVQVTVLD
jgi:hypothetical protein